MKYYQVASKWFVDNIRNGVSHNFRIENNNKAEFLVMILGRRMSEREREEIPEEKYQQFAKCLEKRIKEEIDKNGICFLSTDYAPMDILEEVAYSTGIPEVIFPSKVLMIIKPDKVEVSNGYADSFEVIYP